MQALPRDLGGGLVLRGATAADTDAVTDFDARVFADSDTDEPAEWARHWARDMFTSHPAVGPGNVLLVEDTHAGRIASVVHVIPQMWTYAGIPFGVGRPEIVGTHPDYRRRGLVRTLFDLFHARSATRGDLMQAITGIPWYYRQFGYEMALSLDGGRFVAPADIPPLKAGETEPYTLRPATEADIPLIRAAEAHLTAHHLFACARDDTLWRYTLFGMSPEAGPQRTVRVIADGAGRDVGFVAHMWQTFKSGSLYIDHFALVPGASWAAVMPPVLRAVRAFGEQSAAGDARTLTKLHFELGDTHPAFAAAPALLARRSPPYAWYIRVPDLPAFLRRVAPALERRLATSDCSGHTGELSLSFYRTGVRLTLSEGTLTGIEPFIPAYGDRHSASFPDRTFLQLLCGFRTLEELEYAFPDARVRTDEARVLLAALFPKQYSCVWPLS